MRTALLVPLFLVSLVFPVCAADCGDCPVYLEPVEIIVPRWEAPQTPAVVTVPPAEVPEQPAKAEQDDSVEPLMVIGEIESVFIEDIPHSFPSRIDTGASICSLDVEDVKSFERDGKSWVSFIIRHRETDKVFPFEKPIKRTVLIKQKEDDPLRRPLVSLQVRLGDRTMLRDFTLADRENFEFQVLAGRNLLNGVAVVDVSLSNTVAAE